mmetsp:Transcript_51209/g.94740  ORF Transcript_51209/g.94740 Transcript_51209/m.94740 type:complete len:236 (-) Transcript_51209:7-714(-)
MTSSILLFIASILWFSRSTLWLMPSTLSFVRAALLPISTATWPKRSATKPILPKSLSNSLSRRCISSKQARSSSVKSRSLSPWAAARRELPNKVGLKPSGLSSGMWTCSSCPSKRACASSTCFLSWRRSRYMPSFCSALSLRLRFPCFLKMACSLVSDSLSSCICCLTAWPFCIDSMQLPRDMSSACRCRIFSRTSCKTSYIRTLTRVNSSGACDVFIGKVTQAARPNYWIYNTA